MPYPVLLGTQYVYFMLDHVYINREAFGTEMTRDDWKDAYSMYYGHIPISGMTGKESGKPMKGKKMRRLKIILKTT